MTQSEILSQGSGVTSGTVRGFHIGIEDLDASRIPSFWTHDDKNKYRTMCFFVLLLFTEKSLSFGLLKKLFRLPANSLSIVSAATSENTEDEKMRYFSHRLCYCVVKMTHFDCQFHNIQISLSAF